MKPSAKICVSLTLLLGVCLVRCIKRTNTLFELISPSYSGVHFSNDITENAEYNIINLEYLYNGGGVAVADFNKDGLSDLFFSANMVNNKLYLNKGEMKFEDVSAISGIEGEGRWKSGVAVTDINEDGWPDIYVCATISADSTLRTNMLFVHQGLNEDGIPVFRDEALSYGLDDSGYSSNAVFLDYDRDGDMDLYVLTNAKQHGVPIVYRPKITDGSAFNTDKLFRNNGDGTFTNVSKEAGILIEGYGLGVGIFDINNDGWPDIYVGNDYLTNDILYINKGGTFVNEIDSFIKHQSKFSMGIDIVDINNDAHQDIMTLDMLPENNLRKKTVMGDAGYISYINNMRYGYAHQYARNMVQLNNGNGTFSEIGQMLDLDETEWSWAPLWADYDNDGDRDVLITNGFPKDITDRDFVNYRTEVGNFATPEFLLSKVPSVKVANYAYENNGDLKFTKVTKEWGMDIPSFSNGAVFVDLDNDGDLDYVVNNIDDKAFIYKNNLNEQKSVKPSYLRINLLGTAKNPFGIGTRISIEYGDNQKQFHEHSIYRGYISSVEPTIHFGLGETSVVDKITIIWPDGKQEILSNIDANQTIFLDHQNAQNIAVKDSIKTNQMFSEVSEGLGVSYIQPDYDYVDFNVQRTIPHKFTQYGPGLAVGDVNGDGMEDFVIGSYANDQPRLYLQRASGEFESSMLPKTNKQQVDGGLLLFDIDSDNDLDLYIVSAGFQYSAKFGSANYQDRIYINDGSGNFTESGDKLPELYTSGSCVRAIDFDGDGDLDLFVGGRVLPHEYPYSPKSYLLENIGGEFQDATAMWCPELSDAGMITDAIWTDYDNDGQVDLMLAGEFMSIKLYKKDQDKLVRAVSTGLENHMGWWNSLTSADFDQDGDMDYIAGNMGENNAYEIDSDHPLKIFAGDFDNNQSVDAIMACYIPMEDGERKLCPVHFWDDLVKQSPRFRQQFGNYAAYGKATMNEVLTPEELENAYVLENNYPSSAYIENLGDGRFEIKKLPFQAQVAPVNGILAQDVNQDGYKDVILIGNDFGNEVISGLNDAFYGLVLLNDGKATFTPVSLAESGFEVKGDAKALSEIIVDDQPIFLASQNKDKLMVYKSNTVFSGKLFEAQALDQSLLFIFSDGREERHELYYGNGFLSQSTRKVFIPNNVSEIKIKDMAGKTRSQKVSLITG